jgi:putative addiction module component (TIGR02574 family)
MMATSAKALLDEALKLPANDRAALVENLILSLDKPDPSLDAEWLKEAEDRLAAYHAGEIEAVDAEQVFAELGKQV